MTTSHSGARLLADVGGTNARFAWQSAAFAPISDVRVLPCAAFASIEEAIRHYLSSFNRPKPRVAVIAIANPVDGDLIKMTNHHWSFSVSQVQRALGLDHLEVINDFTALALALPALQASDLKPIVHGQARPGSPIGLIGPGTGLGVSGLLPNGRGGWIPIQGEGGHVTLPALTERERWIARGLAKKYTHASAERAVSGQGLVDMFHLLCAADHRQPTTLTHPSEVTHLARQGHPQALECIHTLTAFLGTVAGNLALTLGAQGGIYIGGGVVPKLGDLFDPTLFRQRFEAKGRFAPYLSHIPVWLITTEQSPALEGAASVANQWGPALTTTVGAG